MVDFENIFHMGIIVPNIESGMKEISSRFGVTWAEPVKPATVPIVRTQEGIGSLSSRFVYSAEGPLWFELIEAVPGTVWAAQTSNIHHIGAFVDDIDAEVERLLAEGNQLEMERLDENGNRSSACYINSELNVRLEIFPSSGRENLMKAVGIS